MTPDSSVLIAGAEPEHVFFAAAGAALAEVRSQGQLSSHAMAETFSVLTRSRLQPPAEALAYLVQFLARPVIGVAPERYPTVLRELAAAEVDGAAVYDGLIAISAREAGLTLISLDRRARRTYERLGVDFRILAEE